MQAKTLFITATGTGVGKTYATLRLLSAFAKKGVRCGVYKPIETGVVSVPDDASRLLKHCQEVHDRFVGLKPRDITAYTFELPAAPFCADSDRSIRMERIYQKKDQLLKMCDVLLIEGAGGLRVPITQTTHMIDLIEGFEAYCLLVTPSRLGCINETELSIEALRRRNIAFDWCVNLYEQAQSFHEITQPYYDAVYPKWWSLQEGLDSFVEKALERFSGTCYR